jgi:adhesin/invasin
MPWAKVYGRKFQWDSYDGWKKIEGSDYTLRAAIPVLPGLIFEAGRRDFVNGTDVNFARISFQITGPERAKNMQPIFAEHAYRLASMEDRRYEKVRRENLIVKQRRSQFKVSFVGI